MSTRLQIPLETLLHDASDGTVYSAYYRACAAANGGCISMKSAIENVMERVSVGTLSISSDRPTVRTCAGCGCTDQYACAFGCAWIRPNRCSSC